jgi:hypothetical protein
MIVVEAIRFNPIHETSLHGENANLPIALSRLAQCVRKHHAIHQREWLEANALGHDVQVGSIRCEQVESVS